MAANKFATMLHRNTNKLTVILTYVILEWILIILLLLNSLYSYLIVKFTEYFGLKRPCILCSRLDHVFEPQKNKDLHRDLVCEQHANEISKLGYCSDHQKLAAAQDMCEDCSSSSQSNSHETYAFFRWVKGIGMKHSDGEKIIERSNTDEMNLNCSCCDVSLNSKFFSPYVLIKPSWEVTDYLQKEKSMIEDEDNNWDLCKYKDDKIEEEKEGDNDEVTINQILSDDAEEQVRNEEGETVMEFETGQEQKYENESVGLIKDQSSDDTLIEISSHVERSFTLEMIDSQIVEDHRETEQKLVPELDLITGVVETEEVVSVHERKEETKFPSIESMELEENEDYFIYHATGGDLVMEVDKPVFISQATQTVSEDGDDDNEAIMEDIVMEVHEQEAAIFTQESVMKTEVCEDVITMEDLVMEMNEQVKITQVKHIKCEFEVINDVQATIADFVMEVNQQDTATQETQAVSEVDDDALATETTLKETDSIIQSAFEEVVESQNNLIEVGIMIETELADQENGDHGAKKLDEEEELATKPISIAINDRSMENDFTFCSENNEMDEDKFPNTPTSIDGLHHLHKNFSSREDSLEGSVISEFESGEGSSTVDKLQSALRAERKALNALYAELEEERSASAIAASQTMAMINRLQEEKAAMEMEAFQYQRMMEEQSEYDQEALQLLNELMVKREREKQELERENEIYRKKVMEFEAREKILMMKRIRDSSSSLRSGNSSVSLSNAEDSDGLSVDLNHENNFYGVQENGIQNTPIDEILNLDDSLAHFEEERISILEQLKVLEGKLFTLDDDEEKQFTDVNSIDQFYEENNENHFDINGNENGFSMELNGIHEQEGKRINGLKAKKLLPLFDAVDAESEEDGHENGFDSVLSLNSLSAKSESESNKHAIEEEVDHVYERLQALEADREFLRHCVGSLKKGDKGIELLQEILVHLRDLRNVDLRVKNIGDNILQ